MKIINLMFLTFTVLLSSCKGQLTSSNNDNLNTFLKVNNNTVETASSGISIWAIYQDKKGNIWFGSNGQGVYKYDGITTTLFNADVGLCSNQIREIKEDKHGNIFISTTNCISKYDGQSFTTLLPIKSNKWKLDKDDVWLRSGVAYNPGPLRYDGNQLHQLEFPKSPNEDEFYKTNSNHTNATYSLYDIYTIYKDINGHLWFGTGNLGLCRYDGKNISWMYEDQLTNTPEGGSFGIRSIFEDSKGKYWICNSKNSYNFSTDSRSESGYHQLSYKKEKGMDFSNLKKDKTYFLSIVEDKNGVLWMSSYREGVYRYDGKEAKQYLIKEGDKIVNVFCIYYDQSGVLWLGTEDNGVYRFNGNEFERFKF